MTFVLFCEQAAFDKLTVDNADQKVQFDNQVAKASLDAANQKASFDNQIAKATLDAGDMKVRIPGLYPLGVQEGIAEVWGVF